MTISEKQAQIIAALDAEHTDIAAWYENIVLMMPSDVAPFVCLAKSKSVSVPNENGKTDYFYAPGKPKIDEYRFALAVGDIIDRKNEEEEYVHGTGEMSAATLTSLETFVSDKMMALLQSPHLILQSEIEYSFDFVGNGNRYAFFASCIVHSRTR